MKDIRYIGANQVLAEFGLRIQKDMVCAMDDEAVALEDHGEDNDELPESNTGS